ncbi:MAG TPA: two-component regulator propeller domain-containing protein [Thermoanaerobaculia bacterium]|nr:two-component regulator propeller domain-containing protein [Thermoanaerobaculia bacterium]
MSPTPAARPAGRRWSKVLAAACALVGALGAGAHQPALAQRLPFNVFSADDGLPATQVWALLQDRRGFLWVGTTWGLARFGPTGVATFSLGEGLPSPTVRTLLEDEDGALWIGTQDGVVRYDGRQIAPPDLEGGAAHSTIWASALDEHGQTWFGGQAGLMVPVGGRTRRYTSAEGLPDDYVYALHATRDGALWIGTRGGGAARCRPLPNGGLTDCRRWSRAEGLGSDVVRAFAEDRDGRVLIGTRGGGVFEWQDGKLSEVDLPGLPSRDVYALLVRENGELVVGTADAGLVRCVGREPRLCRLVGERNGLPEDGVRALLEDRARSLWVATEAGLAHLEPESIWSYAEREGLPDHQVYAVEAGADGTIWVGTFEGLAALRVGPHGEPAGVRVWKRGDGLPGRWVQTLHVDAAGRVWIGLENGLARLEGERLIDVDAEVGLPDENVYALVEAASGELWVGSTGGVSRLRTDGPRVERLRTYTREDGLYSNRVLDLEIDGDGRIWAAQGEALAWLDGDRFRRVGEEAGLPVRSVRGLGLDRRGALLAGGWGYLARQVPDSDPPRFEAWTGVAELSDAVILAAEELEDGRFLLATNRGLLLFDAGAAQGRGAVVARFGRAHGAIGTEVPHSSALARDGRGRWWVGFKGGLSSFGDVFGRPALAPPALAFVRIASTGGRVFRAPFTAVVAGPMGWLGGPPPELPPGDRALRVEVEPLTFRGGETLRYQFRLAGADGSWSSERSEPFRDFTNLDPGEYAIEARASRGRGVWGPPARLELVLRPAFWQTLEARAAAALALLLALLGGVRRRVARADRRTRELERRVAERTDDLERYARALAEHLQTVDRASERERRGHAERREAFARISHELRTPLTAILGFSDLLERSAGGRLEERERRYLANVHDGGEHLLRLVNNLLDQIRLEQGRMEVHLEEVELASMLDSVVSLMEGFALHRSVRVEVTLEPGLPPVRVDVAKLRQVLLNLLSNAVKFSPPGERVRLAARALPADPAGDSPPRYEVSVEDRGPGIAADEVESVFEPYRQLATGDSLTPGSGLGLSIARQLVELLGGTISVDSAAGSGACFRVALPVDPERAPDLGDLAERPAPGRARLLLVEPDAARFRRLAERLERDELLAVRAGDAVGAEGMLAELRPAALVVRVDPAVPESWSGFRGASALAARHGLPLSILVTNDEGLGLALSLDLVVSVADPLAAARRVLATFAAMRGADEAPLSLVVAAGRERGVQFAAEVRRAGAQAFRVEGEVPVVTTFAESPGDLLVLDLSHLLRLAPEVGGGRSGPAVAYGRPKVLLIGGDADEVDLSRLEDRVRREGGESGLALVGSARALLERSGCRSRVEG